MLGSIRSLAGQFRRASLSLGLIVGFLSLTSISCSKKNESSELSMKLPNWNAIQAKSGPQSSSLNTVVSRVIINVSAPDIPEPVVYQWKKDDKKGQNQAEAPTEVSLTVPRGGDRLVQVVVATDQFSIAGGVEQKQTKVYYGDALKSLRSAVEDVEIQLTAQTPATGAVEGSISGRYIAADGSTPTGQVSMYFAPSGKRAMMIERTWIFAGYFNFLALSGVPFDYQLENGVKLFEAVTPDSFLSPALSYRTNISLPVSYRANDDGKFSYRPAQITIAGFFGPGAGLESREICYEPSSEPVLDLFLDPQGSNQLVWEPNSTRGDRARVRAGGTQHADGECTAAADIGTKGFNLDLDQLRAGGSALAMRGPFQPVSQFSQWPTFLDVKKSGNKLVLKFNYLPDSIGKGFNGVGLFYKVYGQNESQDDDWHDQAPCSSLASMGFTEVTRIASTDPNSTLVTHEWNNAPIAAFESGRLKTVLCPYSNARTGYFNFALTHDNRGSSQQDQNQATKILAQNFADLTAVNSTTNRHKMVESECAAVRLRFANANGGVGNRTVDSGKPKLKVLVKDSSDAILYKDAGCFDPATGATALDFEADHGDALVGVKLTSMTSAARLEISDISMGGAALGTISYYVEKVSPPTLSHINTILPGGETNIRTWKCYAVVHARGGLIGSSFIALNGSYEANFGSVESEFEYFGDPNCFMVASSSGTFNGTSPYSRPRFVRYVGSSSSVSLAPIDNAESLTSLNFEVNVTQPAPPTKLRFESSQYPIGENVCTKVRLVAINASGELSPVASAQSITPKITPSPQNGEGLFTDSSCTYQLGSAVISAGRAVSSSDYYFKWKKDETVRVRGNPSQNGLPVATVDWEVED